MRFVELCVATFVAAWSAVTLQRALEWPDWSTYVICLIGTILLHVLAIPLTNKFTHTNTPMIDAALGIERSIPIWVRLMGVLALGYALAIPFQLIAVWVRS